MGLVRFASVIMVGSSLLMTGCATSMKPYQLPSTAKQTAKLNLELEVKKGIPLLTPNKDLILQLSDHEKIASGEGCSVKSGYYDGAILLGKAYIIDPEKVSFGGLKVNRKANASSMMIEANKPYVVDMNYIISSRDFVYTKSDMFSFTPEPNQDYLFKYKEIKTSNGRELGEFQYFKKSNGTYIEIPESEIAPSPKVDCKSILQGNKG